MGEFEEVLQLLLKHRWLFQSPVTEILVDNVMDQFPEGWVEVLESLTILELNDLVIGRFSRDHWPDSLLQFINTCVKVKGQLSTHCFQADCKGGQEFSVIPRQLTLGLNDKKQHEAFRLAQLTHEMCLKEELDVIVDLGAGLGYICQLLHHLFGYRVLGLESNPKLTATAIRRRDTLHPSSSPSVQYSCLKVSENSSLEIEELVKAFTNCENPRFCLIGLHSCGDLSTSALSLFRDIKNAKILIMMSCCYHKMAALEGDKGFKNFPMSRGLQGAIQRTSTGDTGGSGKALRRPFLRLACQESSERWEGLTEEAHEVHSICLTARAVLELFCRTNEIKLTKTRRKSARSWQCRNFESYLLNVIGRYNFNGQPLDKRYYEEINQLWEEKKSQLRLLEVYTGLQLLLQAPAEYLVLNDRRCWLEEQGFTQTKIVSVLDRKLSPRSHAIISLKTKSNN